MKIKYLLLSLVLISMACSSNSDEVIEKNSDIVGLWEMTEFQMDFAQDLKSDGVSSTNLLDELECLFVTIQLNDDFTLTTSGMGLNFQQLTETTFDINCTVSSTTEGTWTRTEQGITISPNHVYTYVLKENKLYYDNENESPYHYKFVYTKIN